MQPVSEALAFPHGGDELPTGCPKARRNLQWPNEPVISRRRLSLARSDGMPSPSYLDEIDARYWASSIQTA